MHGKLNAVPVFVPAITSRSNRADRVMMRAVDIMVASVALFFFAPLMIVIAALVFVGDPGPILFAHRRIGRGGKDFYCLKFRSMAVDADARLRELLAVDAAARDEWARDHKLRNDPRITGIGRFLRKSSLDELPQLFNVLRGDMSLVGPRPIVQAEAERYGRYLSEYCAVRPGITGLWQVSGRNDTTYRRRVAMDVAYSRKCSTSMNLKILAVTVPSVVFAKGSY
ncbi:sugar transferase [Stakelama pacifica]|uniref:Lipopolysaccharide/colanic/teichoic acid biosynthesis glycosyltransferase n=2 Tax=Stakelama pacifica TaxID=517720 RepID=A0A4R6FID8_9SPHN|nr:lipopolysaccharide/colanic/teichoic acid biosynthesis glycosyltransferase [Stakelama pacifica]